ncbi:MAG: CpaF family protein [Clostridiales bacterium]|nr:CpaF family protein [Clostridiales bacterium]
MQNAGSEGLARPQLRPQSQPQGGPADGLFREIKSDMLDRLDLKRDMDDAEVMDIISEIVLDKTRRTYVRLDERRLLAERVFNSIRRLDVIQPLLDDAGISEIMVNGHRDIFVERDGKVRKTGLMFESAEKLEDVIQSIVSKVNRSVNESTPIADARLADGSRVNVVLSPIALDGPALTIRKFPDKPMSVARLLAFGSLSEAIAEFLGALVRARYNVLISGGTGSGKTSLLNAIAALIPAGERVITIEDSAELQLGSISNIVRLETRNANTEGKGAIGMGSLIKASLRMRPDRIIVGEVRDGPAAYYMLQSMNTGHDGSLTTGHANSAKDMLSRLETMVLSEEAMPIEAIRKQIASAIDVIVHVARLRDGSRKIVEISELAGIKDGGIRLNKLFEFQEGAAAAAESRLARDGGGAQEDSGASPGSAAGAVVGSFRRTGSRLRNGMKMSLAGMESDLLRKLDAQNFEKERQ